jgi:hypothetical protein
MKKFEFQVNLGYGKKHISGCGYTPEGTMVFFATSLRMLLRKIVKKTGIPIEQIALTFQPSPQP